MYLCQRYAESVTIFPRCKGSMNISHRQVNHELNRLCTSKIPQKRDGLLNPSLNLLCLLSKIVLLSPLLLTLFTSYIMPPMPGAPPIGIAGSFSGLSQIRHSVVRNMPAIEAAFSRATRATLAGSITPASRRSS